MSEALFIAADTAVTCPQCGHEFSLEQGFARQALENIESASSHCLSQLRAQERQSADKHAQQLLADRQNAARQENEELRGLLKDQGEAHARALAEMRAMTEQAFKPQLDALQRQLAETRERLAATDQREAALAERESSLEMRVAEAASARAAQLLADEKQAYEKQLADARQQLQSLRAEQLALREERTQLKDARDALQLDVQRQVDAKLNAREATARSQEQQRAALEKAELQKTIDDMKARLTEAQRKADQGSQQLQGEVLELAIEESLKRSFPGDTIEEVKKGVRGADVLQRVYTRNGEAAGLILWESKRARDWSPQWIAKLKDDMRACGADISVLLTMPAAVPKEWQAGQLFGLHDDVWVSTWAPALQLATALRAGLLEVHKQRQASAGKGEKMEAVYDYLTSPQFAQKLRAVYDMFQRMREELESEKNQSTQRWARREKQLQAGVSALLGIGGEIQGLAQQPLPALEMEPQAQ